MRSLAAARSVVAPLALGVAFVLAWQWLVTGLDIKPFVLPAPFSIGESFTDKLDTIVTAARGTGKNALIGLIVGGVLGVALAAIAHLLPVLQRLGSPVVTALSVIPIVALAPVLYTMLGAGEQTARQVVASIAVFVPVYVNSLRGFERVPQVQRDLLFASAATRWQTTWRLTLPSAIPHMATGLRIASSLAVISALIAEYFGGPVGGLGKAITSAAASSNYTLAWAYVIGSILLGLLFYCVTAALEYLANRR